MARSSDYTERQKKGLVEFKIAAYKAMGLPEREAVIGGLTDMKIRERRQEVDAPPDTDVQYPDGLCITLDNDTLEALNIEELPQVGTTVTIQAVGVVKRIAESHEGTRPCRSVGIQMTHMALDPEGRR